MLVVQEFDQLQLESKSQIQYTNPAKFIRNDLLQASKMDVLELKREIEMLSSRLGKTQDYL
jgi:hypothetical protein